MFKFAIASALLMTACADLAPVESIEDLPLDSRAKAPDAMWRALVAQEPRSFIVALSPRATDRAMRRDHKARLLAAAPDEERTVENDWDELPLVQVRATTLAAARAMVERDEVAAVYEVEHFRLTDEQSFPLINQPAAAAAGDVGAGTSVAVLDTGTDYTRSDFGSCTAPGAPASCRVAYAQDFAPSDNALDANGHGTNVAGIIAGVAPGAKILALDVFDGEGASSTDIISAINWSIANRDKYHIASMNLSLGGGASTAPCSNDAIGVALGQARTAGIAPVVASGNNGYTNQISSPGCAPAAISVGAVYDSNVGGLRFSNCTDATTAADQITCFSNSASFLTVLAPGALITAAGYTMAGTSQATPHVAGAMAVLRAAFPSETVDQLVARLTSTGKQIRDARNGVTKSRIDLFAAVGAPSVDTTPPRGTVAINGGAATTRTAAVSLAITASDPSGVAQMCVTNTATCTAFEAFAATKNWTLAAGDGAKTVTVFLRDQRGNTSSATSDPRAPSATITVDATAPANGTATAEPGNGQASLRWSGFTDAGSGVASYRVVAASGATAPANCSGTPVYTGTATSAVVTGLTNGTAYAFRVCALDGAGNSSTGATASATPRSESNPPVGSLQINSGAAVTRSLTVMLMLVATDDSGVAQMCISDTATTATACPSWVAYAASKSYAFTAGDGVRTLRAWYRDRWGNTSQPASASIRIDTTAPTGGALSATAGVDRIALSWTAASDAGAGLDGYRLVGAPGTAAPASGCTSGTVLYTGAATAFSHAIARKSTWSYRLCATDKAGNTSVGTTKTVTAQ